MDYKILGPLEVRSDGVVLALPGIKERALLALLVVELGTVVSADRIIFELWGDEPPRTARATLRSLVSRLRRHLGSDAVMTARPGYRLGADPSAIDSIEFEALADDALRLRHEPERAGDIARRAIRLWRGRALADLEGFRFAETEARRLGERRLAVMEIAFAGDLVSAEHGSVVAELREAIDVHPFHEPFYEQLMLALHRSGRTAEALGVFSQAQQVLGDELGIEPSQGLRSLERSIVMGDETLQLPPRPPPHNLPRALSSFVGRDREVALLIDAVRDRRVITLTGPGGSGKSRLSLEVAHRVVSRHEHGAWRVELAPLRDLEGVAYAISGALGEPVSHATNPIESLTDYLGPRDVLLVLDNCEHLIGSIARVVDAIVATCPDVTILATSREPLGVAGESVWLVPPLRVPERHATPGEQDASDAVRLFVSRARETDAAFVLDATNRPWIVDICRAVDGLPLALELAASRLRAFSARQIAQRLSTDLGVLAADNISVLRHRTMRAALDWSHQLLDESQAEVFRKLAVFRGGWTVEDCDAVLGEGSSEIVGELVNRSLVLRLRGQTLDYRLLEPVREYAKELFERAPGHEAVSRRHAERCRDLAAESTRALRGPAQIEWMGLMEAEHDNLRRAIRFALDGGHAGIALELVAAAGWFWFMAGYWKESQNWLEEALAVAGDGFPAERAAAIYRTAAIQVIRVNHEAVLPMVHEALTICERVGDRYGKAWCHHLIGHAATFERGDGGLEELRLSRRLFEELGCAWEVAWSDRFIGGELCEIGEGDAGSELLLGSLSAFREMGDLWQTAYGLFVTGAIFLAMPDWGPDAARPYLQRCQRLAEEIGDRVWAAHAVSRLAMAAGLAGFADPEPLFLDAMERHRLIGDDACLSTCLGHLGRIHEDRGDRAGAADFYGEALRVAHRIRRVPTLALNYCRLARLAVGQHGEGIARRLLAAVAGARRNDGIRFMSASADEVEAALDLGGRPAPSSEEIESLLPLALELAASIADGYVADDRAR